MAEIAWLTTWLPSSLGITLAAEKLTGCEVAPYWAPLVSPCCRKPRTFWVGGMKVGVAVKEPRALPVAEVTGTTTPVPASGARPTTGVTEPTGNGKGMLPWLPFIPVLEVRKKPGVLPSAAPEKFCPPNPKAKLWLVK